MSLASSDAQGVEARYRLLIDAITDYAIYMLDPVGNVSSWNPGAQRFKGYTAREIVGQHFSAFYTDEDRARGVPVAALETAAREGKFESEGWRVRKDGERFWAAVVIDAIRGEDGELIGFAKITRDITERRNANEALAKAQQALFQAQKLEAIGQMTGGVAHDFNNLLTVIVSTLELLRRKVREPRDVKMLENALLAAERGTQLTSQLLSFARRQPLQPKAQNPNQLIETFEAILHRAAGEKLVFELELGQPMRSVLLDAAQFEASLLNLVVNARDATTGQGLIRICSEVITLNAPRPVLLTSVPAGTYVLVSVRDGGSGMTAEVLAHALDPFYTTKEVGKGTGLGLSQVYGFVAQSDGYIDIETAENEGTTIRMYLPAGEPVAEEPAASHGNAGTVLVVDDDEQVLAVAVEIFDALGFKVLTANNGRQALEILKRGRRIDVLFSDVVMPGDTSGIDLSREARILRPELKIILSSGYPLPALDKSNGSLGGTAFISKPYRWSEVAERLRLM